MLERTHLRVAVGDDGVATVLIEVRDEPMNVLSPAVAEDFDRVLDFIERDGRVKAVVIASGRPDVFVAGADVRLLRDQTDPAEASRLARALQERFQRIEDLHQGPPAHSRRPPRGRGKPVVVAIHGPAMGGGLEMALCASYRVCSDSPRTVLGLPEVKIGVLPAGGGSTRLPRLVGIRAALDLILTGRDVRPAHARKIGLVDEVVPQAILLDVARRRAREMAASGGPAASGGRRGPPAGSLPDRLGSLLLERNPLGRAVLFRKARSALLAQTRGRYPAPEAALEVVRVGVERGPEAGFRAEAERFGPLAVSPEAKALMSLFFATTDLKKDSGVEDPAVAARPVKRLGLLGGGLMGAGIAAVTLERLELPVRVREADLEGAARCVEAVRKTLRGWARKRRMTPMHAGRLGHLLTTTTGMDGFAGVDLVIEAVFEDLDLKQRLLREVEAATGPDTIFASNTSSIPIARIAEASSHPETVIGMHYFSPVEKMPLLEVVVTDRTAPWVIATCVAFGKAQGKTVIVVRDGPGFYTTRILAPYLNEAAHLLAEGVRMDGIDEAARDRGFPVGPITLLDEVGIDVGAKVAGVLSAAFGARMKPPGTFEALVRDDRKGRKNGRGFYRYEKGHRVTGGRGKPMVDESVYRVLGLRPDARRADPAEVGDRLLFAMVNEAARCLGDRVLRNPRDGDVGAVFGLGFPPYLGGPFWFVDRVGATKVVRRLEDLASRLGPRFEPAEVLVAAARSGRRFHVG